MPHTRRPWLVVLAVLITVTFAAGCVSMPSGGPVLSYTVTQGPGGQSQPYPQIIAQPPGAGWTPEQIVQGFLTASASLGDRQKLAREYLTPGFSRSWNLTWSATVYSDGPTVNPAVLSGGSQKKAQVTVTGTVQANLSGSGSYAVPSAKEQQGPQIFGLVKTGGQWRIDSAPQGLLLTSDLFRSDYQLRNLYFCDPTGRYLVPDPVYVPLQATPANLMTGLVHDLISPPRDWLYDATRSAFPPGTTMIGDVALDGGTATVNLGGAIAKASSQVMEQVSAQLFWTLSGSGQGGQPVQSVQVNVNGRPWIPKNSDENPVQHQAQYGPSTGASRDFYYLDSAGNLLRSNGTSGKGVKVARIGAGYSHIVVSPDGRHLAALRGGSLFIGPVGGRLVKRGGAGYTSMSWDSANDLWTTTGDQIVMLRGDAGPAAPQGWPVAVSVVDSYRTPVLGPYTALRVAPDGVRVALIVGGSELRFGAIVSQSGARAGQLNITIMLSPFYVAASDGTSFSAVTWYGPDNVITLGGPGPALTEYPVNGGSPTPIPSQTHFQSISASWGSALVAGVAKGGMTTDTSLTGSWMPVRSGVSPTYPG